MIRPAAALVLLTALSLTACSSTGPSPTASPSASSAASNPESADPALTPLVVDATAEAYASEAERLATAFQAHLDSATIVSIDDVSELVAADGNTGSYHVIERSFTMDASLAVESFAATLTNVFAASGWNVLEAGNSDGLYQAALALESGDAAWLVILQADSTIEGAPTIELQIASPDLPEA